MCNILHPIWKYAQQGIIAPIPAPIPIRDSCPVCGRPGMRWGWGPAIGMEDAMEQVSQDALRDNVWTPPEGTSEVVFDKTTKLITCELILGLHTNCLAMFTTCAHIRTVIYIYMDAGTYKCINLHI